MSFLKRDKSRLNLGLSSSPAGQSNAATPMSRSGTQSASTTSLQNLHITPVSAARHHSLTPYTRTQTAGGGFGIPPAVLRNLLLLEPRTEYERPRLAATPDDQSPTNTQFIRVARKEAPTLLLLSPVLLLLLLLLLDHAAPRLEFRSQSASSIVDDTPRPAARGLTGESYLPRLSMVLLSQAADHDGEDDALKDTYRGFHRRSIPQANVPPLSQPIKPRFRKKGLSLLGKLIHSNRKDSDLGLLELDRGSAKHKFRLPLISHHPNHQHLSTSRHPSISEDPSDTNPGSDIHPSPSKVFDLDLNFDELQSIVRTKGSARPSVQLMSTHPSATDVTKEPENEKHLASWKAPDSWDVTEDAHFEPGETTLSGSESDDKVDDDKEETRQLGSNLLGNSSQSLLLEVEEEHKKHKRKIEAVPSFPERRLPVLFGTVSSRSKPATDSKLARGPNHIIRVFKEDNTFTTILCPLETTTAELLTIVQRKFFFELISNFQITLYLGSKVKVLEPFEKPLKIQMGLLTLSGYTENDNLRIIGREDLSFVCKFVVENMFLRNLTHEEELVLSKDYVDVNISSLNLKTIPIIFHQHTYEIEKLNVADNPAIYIPLDFIQSCTNLNSINFSKNGCSKFPVNFLEAHGLTNLNMETNFLDELPSRISHLEHLQNLKLNSNQLYYLPRSFGKLANLVSLNLSSNYFHEYPESVNDLVNLQDLDLSYNDLSSVPDSIARLSKLTKLNLSTNKLSKSLPACFKMLVNLKRLDIRYNRISNVDVLGSLPNLEVVYASKNKISAFSDKMERLRLLHFDRNPITNLEFEILLPMLTVLDLSKAKITAIPAEFISKIPHIEKLVLDKNHLVNLPEQLGDLPRLTYLSLYGNNIQHLPNSIGQLTSLQYLDLHSNNLDSLPAEIWNLKGLSVLNVASNILSSFPKPLSAVAKRISSSVNIQGGAISSLEEANAMNASALRNGPVSLADSLMLLTLADNRLTDESFESLSLLTQLKSLNLSYNDIIEIPEGVFSRFTHLSDLYLSGNGLTKLPADDIETLTDLKLLYLNNNKLPTLPSELSKLTNLMHLDVGSNQLRYNVSNWPYDWNWCWNTKLKYLNFSGNKRFEIKQSYVKNPETGEDFDSLLVLKHLKVLGLIDVTLTTPAVPDQSVDIRIRTTSSELNNVGYGVSDSMGARDYVSTRDMFIQKFRGNENEVLLCSFDGKVHSHQESGHLISFLAKQLFVQNFTNELNRLTSDENIQDAMRRAFLSLNKDINSVLAAQKAGYFTASAVSPDLASLRLADDAFSGCAMSALYIKDKTVFCGNVGDLEVVLSKSNGEHTLLSTKHDPTTRTEFERVRASGGYVSGDGALDGGLQVSRGVGFFNYLPHTNSGPSIKTVLLSGMDDLIVMATKALWDYVTYDLAVDILRQEKDDPMIAAQKLRDYAICYGATDKISVTVICIGDQKKKKLSLLYNNLGRENEMFANKKKKDRGAQSGDTALRRLNDEIDPPVGDLALVFTDIKNSTLLWDTYPVAMRSAIKLHNTIMRRQLRIVGGYEVKTEGDSFMVSFPSPTSALLWCFNVQNQLLHEEWPSEILETNECCEVTDDMGTVIFRGLSVRMGIHWGSPVCELDMVTRRMDYFGPMVNRTSRINSSADGGQIAVSSDFLHEMEQLYHVHDMIASGATTVQKAYEGNPRAGEIIEKEINALEEIGYSYFVLGERKLKGLETPEMITLAYPKKLEERFEIFKKRQDQDTNVTGRVVGAVQVDSVYQLRTVSLRLENICSALHVGSHMDESFLKDSSGVILTSTATAFQETELVGLLNHLVTRIENCVANLEIRQKMQEVRGNHGRIDFTNAEHIWTLMDEVNDLLTLLTAAKKTETYFAPSHYDFF